MIAIGVAGLAACGNVSGHIATTKLGDTTHPAERSSPVDDLRAACGDGATTTYGASEIQREPYLQQVTTSGAKLGWVSKQADGEHVTITNPPGGAIATLAAEPETGSLRSAGENQLWSSAGSLEPDTI
ncbi:MAG TPA: hypothetical protein VFS15_24750, partial [Kofleriaceae bacterium]|nr:hypothetical protein [Kofleriaceae bacterium]